MNLHVVKGHLTLRMPDQYQIKQTTVLAVWAHCWSYVRRLWLSPPKSESPKIHHPAEVP